MTPLLLAAAVSGLVGSPHCVGMCGGFAVAASDAPVPYHLGRLLTVSILGVLAGAFGARIPGPPWVGAVISIAVLGWFSMRLAGVGPSWHLAPKRLVVAGRRLLNERGWMGRLGLGASTALLPCGLVWAAMGMAVGAGSAWGGALVMAAFWLGTVPLLAAVSVGSRAVLARSPRVRGAVAVGVFVAGSASIVLRMPAADAPADAAPACHAE